MLKRRVERRECFVAVLGEDSAHGFENPRWQRAREELTSHYVNRGVLTAASDVDMRA